MGKEEDIDVEVDAHTHFKLVPDADYYLSVGLRYFREKNYKASIQILSDALIKFPRNNQIIHTLSWIMTEKKSHQDRCILWGGTSSARAILNAS